MRQWRCLICEKPVYVDIEGDDDKGIWPAIEGGTITISFGWCSRFDDMNGLEGESVEHQACICDDCYAKKMHLTRPVVHSIEQCWKTLSLDYRKDR